MFALVVCLLVELNAFFLLTTLSIPKESNFNAYRLSLMFLIGIPGAAEVRPLSMKRHVPLVCWYSQCLRLRSTTSSCRIQRPCASARTPG